MKTVQPQTGAREFTLAVQQPEYEPLVVAGYVEVELGSSALLSRWKPTEEERERLAAGEDLYLCLLTFGSAPQPVLLQVGPGGFVAGETYSNFVAVPAVHRVLCCGAGCGVVLEDDCSCSAGEDHEGGPCAGCDRDGD